MPREKLFHIQLFQCEDTVSISMQIRSGDILQIDSAPVHQQISNKQNPILLKVVTHTAETVPGPGTNPNCLSSDFQHVAR